MTGLLKNAVAGVNIILTALLGLVLLYWITVIVGALDLDFLDFDLDLDGIENSNPLYSLVVFLNIAEVPFGLVFSLIVLNFWIIAMLIYYIPIEAGGVLNGLLLIPSFVISVFITKYEAIPLKAIFKDSNTEDNSENQIIEHRCILMCNVNNGRLGQAEIKRDGASIVINVKAEYEEETFAKNEIALVSREDKDKNIYYIIKIPNWML